MKAILAIGSIATAVCILVAATPTAQVGASPANPPTEPKAASQLAKKATPAINIKPSVAANPTKVVVLPAPKVSPSIAAKPTPGTIAPKVSPAVTAKPISSAPAPKASPSVSTKPAVTRSTVTSTGAPLPIPMPIFGGHASTQDQSRLVSLLSDSVVSLSTQSSPTDPRYFSNGVWWSGSDGCFRCNIGPGVAAAVSSAATGDKTALDLAIQTFDHAIATNRAADGSFGPPSGSETGPDIQTMMFANELGTALIALKPQLDPGRIQAWTSALTGAADWLIRNKNLTWYTNGNIVLGNAETMALAYQETGSAIYQAAYETALGFAISPPQARWAGYGLMYTVTPTRSDGSDGAGYLTEAGASGPGYDPEYTGLQADVATQLFWINGDPRVLRLMNLFMNQLMPRIDTTAWTLDTSGGSRHTQANRKVGFNSPVLAELAWKGGRTDLAQFISSQVIMIDRNFRGALTYSNPGTYFDSGSQPAMVLLAAVS